MSTLELERFSKQSLEQKRITLSFHQDGLIWSVNTLTIMVGMSSQQPSLLVPTGGKKAWG